MLVISAKSGQLGNRLLLFANFIAFAIENNLTVLNPAFDEYADYFQMTAADFLCCYPQPKIKIKGNSTLRKLYYEFNRCCVNKKLFNIITLDREWPFSFSQSRIFEQIQDKPISFFQGWLFRDGWFVEDKENLLKHAEQVRAYFAPLKKHQNNVSALISNMRENADILIGLHIRQGDYKLHQNGRYFYQSEQYLAIMKSIIQLFPEKKVQFLICSNVPQPANLFDQFSYSFGTSHLVEDLYALAQCDYLMGPPSSYTMWASFYGDKPLYMIREVHKPVEMKDFVYYKQWEGKFHYQEDWSRSVWEWIH